MFNKMPVINIQLLGKRAKTNSGFSRFCSHMKKFRQEMKTNHFIQIAVRCSHWFIAEFKAYDWSSVLLASTVSNFVIGHVTKNFFSAAKTLFHFICCFLVISKTDPACNALKS